jgi:hypothetical protein
MPRFSKEFFLANSRNASADRKRENTPLLFSISSKNFDVSAAKNLLIKYNYKRRVSK